MLEEFNELPSTLQHRLASFAYNQLQAARSPTMQAMVDHFATHGWTAELNPHAVELLQLASAMEMEQLDNEQQLLQEIGLGEPTRRATQNAVANGPVQALS